MASNISSDSSGSNNESTPPELTDFLSMDRDTLYNLAAERDIQVTKKIKHGDLVLKLVEDEIFDWNAAKNYPTKATEPNRSVEILSVTSFGDDQAEVAKGESGRAKGVVGRAKVKAGEAKIAAGNAMVKEGEAMIEAERADMRAIESRKRTKRAQKSRGLDEIAQVMRNNIQKNVDKDKQEETLANAEKMIEKHRSFIFNNVTSEEPNQKKRKREENAEPTTPASTKLDMAGNTHLYIQHKPAFRPRPSPHSAQFLEETVESTLMKEVKYDSFGWYIIFENGAEGEKAAESAKNQLSTLEKKLWKDYRAKDIKLMKTDTPA